MTRPILACALLAAALPAAAGGFSNLGALTQGEFRSLSEDLGAAAAYKGVTPATALGLVGFDIGLEASATDVKHGGLFRRAGNSEPDYLFVPKLHVYKGLPLGFDIGAFVGGMSNVNATLYGVDLRYALLEDSGATPALALRASGTRANDAGGIDLKTYGMDLMVSKRLAIVTPYLGAGRVRMKSSADGVALAGETLDKTRYFGGLNMNFAIVNLAIEAERLGDNTTVSAKAGWRF